MCLHDFAFGYVVGQDKHGFGRTPVTCPALDWVQGLIVTKGDARYPLLPR